LIAVAAESIAPGESEALDDVVRVGEGDGPTVKEVPKPDGLGQSGAREDPILGRSEGAAGDERSFAFDGVGDSGPTGTGPTGIGRVSGRAADAGLALEASARISLAASSAMGG
jgi:hypothetical protein